MLFTLKKLPKQGASLLATESFFKADEVRQRIFSRKERKVRKVINWRYACVGECGGLTPPCPATR